MSTSSPSASHRLELPAQARDIVEEHFDELDFLWEQRERAVFASDWTCDDLRELEERAEAHRDGLRLARPFALELAIAKLDAGEPIGATSAAFVLLDGNEPADAKRVVDALRQTKGEVAARLRAGLRHSEIDTIADQLHSLLDLAPHIAASAADVLAFHGRKDPRMRRGLEMQDPVVRALGYAALARSSALRLDDVKAALAQADPSFKRSALESAALAGLTGVADLCRESFLQRGDAVALEFLGVVGGDPEAPLIRAAIEKPSLAASALRALGALGRSVSVPWLLAAADAPALRCSALAAFARIVAPYGSKLAMLRKLELEPIDAAELEPALREARELWNARASDFESAPAWQEARTLVDRATPDLDGFSLATRRDVYLGLRARRGASVPYRELEARLYPAAPALDTSQVAR